jgi:hypothetical protein
MPKTLADGSIQIEQGDTLEGIYGSNWKEASGYSGDPTKLQVGTVLPGVKNNNIITANDLQNAQGNVQIPAKPDVPAPVVDTTPDWVKKYTSIAAPDSNADLWKTESDAAGISDKEEAVTTAQKELDLLNAQLQGLNDTATAQNLKVENQGAGITSTGVNKSQTANSREIAIQALPLQALIMAKQAVVTNNTNLLKLAEDRLTNTFKLKSEDAKAKYEYNKDLRDKVLEYATEAEKTKLATQQKEDDRAFTTSQNNLNYAQTLSINAINNGQPELAAEITKLDPASKTFKADLAALQKKMVAKPTTTASPEDKETASFKSDAASYIEKLDKGEVKWGTAFDSLKTKFPMASDALIDQMLGGGYDESKGGWWGRAKTK